MVVLQKRSSTDGKVRTRKALHVFHTSRPRIINVDKNAAYPQAVDELKEKKE